jgi:hypothetical protein
MENTIQSPTVQIFQIPNVLILEKGIKGIYGHTIRINASVENENRNKFRKICKDFNETLSDVVSCSVRLWDKKSDEHSYTIEFIGEQNVAFIQKTAIDIANELKLPLVIL